ncbi:MAG: CcmD family protein [Bacteroidetes bacterium]|nr:CcmD family protein [Bacteroidota bacterium]
MNKFISTLICFLVFNLSFAQSQSGPQMADAFRENGKIYVVIAVIAIIFVSIIAFLIYIERKIKNINDKVNKKS